MISNNQSRRRSKRIAASALALTLAVSGGLIAGSAASAATADSAATQQSQGSKAKAPAGVGTRFFALQGYEDKLAAFLHLSTTDLQDKLKTSTLAEIAEAQGITRDALKAQLVSWINEARASRSASAPSGDAGSGGSESPPDSSTLADQLLDSQGARLLRQHKGGLRLSADDLASLLGITADELKQEESSGETLAEVAEAHGITREALKEKLESWFGQQQANAAANGGTSSSEASQPAFDVSAWIDKVIDATDGWFGAGGKGPMAGIGARLGDDADAVASSLGLTADEVKDALKSGKTIADLAAQQGVDVQTVIDALTAKLKERLSEQLSAGKLTQEQYDNAVAKLAERAEAIVSGKGGVGRHSRPPMATGSENNTAEDSSAP